MSRPDCLNGATNTVEQVTGRRPRATIVHLVPNGTHHPAADTPDRLQHYIERNLLGKYNTETRNAIFAGSGWAAECVQTLNLIGYDGVDVTELLMRRRGLDPSFQMVFNPQALEDLGNEVITQQELEELHNSNPATH